MARYMVAAFTDPVEGREDEFNDWYDNVAIPIFEGIPNMKILGRFKQVEGTSGPNGNPLGLGWKYLTVYQHETDDIHAHFEMIEEYLAKATEEQGYSLSDALDKERMFEPIFEEM